MRAELPIVFACSGCSEAGQLASQVALELNLRGIAEMSCLAGVRAAKRHFLKQLHDREVWIIDGCPLECSLGTAWGFFVRFKNTPTSSFAFTRSA